MGPARAKETEVTNMVALVTSYPTLATAPQALDLDPGRARHSTYLYLLSAINTYES